MLDDDDGVPLVNETVKHALQEFHISCMESDGRLLKNVEGAALFLHSWAIGSASSTGQLGDELDALSLSATQSGAGLTQLQVAEACLHKELQGPPDFRMGVKELRRLLDGHGEDIPDRLAVVFHLQRLPVEAGAHAVFARHVGDWEKVHLQLDDPLALAASAATAVIIEGEPTAGVAAQSRFRQARVECPDRVEDLQVGGGCRA